MQSKCVDDDEIDDDGNSIYVSPLIAQNSAKASKSEHNDVV